MSEEGLLDFGIRIGESAARRFVHWDPVLWDDLLTGPLHALAQGLSTSPLSHHQASALGRSYLELAAEAVGLGYLYPASAGRANVFSLLWRDLIPRDLPHSPSERQPELLAACWNLGENVETSPAWLQRILLHECAQLPRLDDLEQMVAAVSRRVIDTPSAALGTSPRAVLVQLNHDDRRFFPGWSHFVAPTVVCVHDRLRTSAETGRDVTCGVMLDDTPLVLGPLTCDERAAAKHNTADGLSRFSLSDARLSPALHVAANEWRAAASLVTSQYLLVLCP